MSAVGWYNGTIGKLAEMTVPILDRAVYFGDGCYEACLAVEGRAFALERHLDRFYRSLSMLSIPFATDRDALKTALRECLAAANEDCAVLYWQASRATAPRVHAFPEGDAKPNLLITVTPKTLLPAGRTLRLITVPDVRYALCHIKTLNLIPNVLASERARASGADEAVFVRDGFVTEGAHTNVHILKNGTLFTHPANERILPGVTRLILLAICERLDVPVREQAFTKDALFSADEVLVTSSTLGVRRARTVDGAPVGGGADTLYRAIAGAYEQIFQEDIRL
ncbi:MAG: aminotransferase class IV [Clostridia bacterium]|nr:aminotransferase class IV [Clostridia bacterium]